MDKIKIGVIAGIIILVLAAMIGIPKYLAYKNSPEIAYKKANPQKYEQAKKQEVDLLAKVKANDQDQNSWIELGVIHEQFKDYSRALSDYKKAISISETTIMGWINSAYIYSELGQYAETESAYKNVIRLYPLSSQGYDALGHLYLIGKIGSLDDAKKAFADGLAATKDEQFQKYIDQLNFNGKLDE